MVTILRHPRPGFTWDWWAVDTEGFLVQFSGGPAPEYLLAHLNRVDAAAAWAEDHRPAWCNPDPLPLHAFGRNGESDLHPARRPRLPVAAVRRASSPEPAQATQNSFPSGSCSTTA